MLGQTWHITVHYRYYFKSNFFLKCSREVDGVTDVLATKLLCFQGHKMDSIKAIMSANKNMLHLRPFPLKEVKVASDFQK